MYQINIPTTNRYDDPPAYNDVMRSPNQICPNNKNPTDIDGPLRPLPAAPRKMNTFKIASQRLVPKRKRVCTTENKCNERARRFVPPYQRKTGLGTKLCFMLFVTVVLIGVGLGTYCYTNKKWIFNKI